MNRAVALLTLAVSVWLCAPAALANSGSQGLTRADSQALGNAAREARRQGRLFTAAWATERALNLSPVAPIAEHEAVRLGWRDAASSQEGELPSPWPWWLVGLAAWLALLAAAWALRDRIALMALAIALLAALFALPSDEVDRPTLPDSLSQPLDPSACPSQTVYWEGGRLIVEANCQGRDARWTVTRQQAGGKFAAKTAGGTTSMSSAPRGLR